tara:strand:- start:26003 stop:26446 length:444 start_codon:yes stop_codon:yes gene_type:complete
MDLFYTIVIVIAVVILILALTYIGILVTEKTMGSNMVAYPPVETTCPDNWTVRINTDATDGVNQVQGCNIPDSDMKNTGTLYDVGSTTLVEDLSDNTPGFNSGTNGNYIDFQHEGWVYNGLPTCAKKTWANTYNIEWDGITNYSLCD